MCWNKGRLYWKTAKLFCFWQLKNSVRPETFGPTVGYRMQSILKDFIYQEAYRIGKTSSLRGFYGILCTSSSAVYWLISNKHTKHSLNTHKRDKKRTFTEHISSLSGSVANTSSVKHMSFVSKLEAIHYRNLCTLNIRLRHTHTLLVRTVDISNTSC